MYKIDTTDCAAKGRFTASVKARHFHERPEARQQRLTEVNALQLQLTSSVEEAELRSA